MKNIDLASSVFKLLVDHKVTDIIVCSGARNLPFLEIINNYSFTITSYFEERSAGFFALGLSESQNRPVAVITTSGTAAAELLPAMIEAYYQNIPLIVVSADRPKKYRGSGAPQAIDQVHFFSSCTEVIYDWDVFEKDYFFKWSGRNPLHLNICFDEPLIDKDIKEQSPISILNQFKLSRKNENENRVELQNIKSPFVIVSQVKIEDRQAIFDFIIKNQLFHIAEAQSGLLNHAPLSHLQIKSAEVINILIEKNIFKSIIRIGGVPTVRTWRDLENKFKDTPVYNFSHRKFSGLSRISYNYSVNDLIKFSITAIELDSGKIKDLISQVNEKTDILVENFLNSEPSMIYHLSRIVLTDPIYIGNSLPIREWDLFSKCKNSDKSDLKIQQPVFANRGANGIDGQISTYIGWSKKYKLSYCLIGDLTALYDLAALGLAQPNNGHRIIIVNNSGGQIFNRLFSQEQFLNSQNVEFEYFAKMWKWNFLSIQEGSQLDQISKLGQQNIMIELKPNQLDSQSFWTEWDSYFKNLLVTETDL